MKTTLRLLPAAGLLFAVALVSQAEEKPAFQPKSMAYVLQGDSFSKKRAEAVKKLRECGRDLIVVDYSYSGAADGKWTAAEIETIRKGQKDRKVVSYISIGEAEDYRDYWKKDWGKAKGGKGKNAPVWLDKVNPDWKGNFKVRYWNKDWQAIILKFVDQIVDQGFDGLYLDIVDGFEYYEHDLEKKAWIDNRKNPDTGNTYRQDMIKWVQTIAEYARKKKAGCIIIPQNGSQLLEQEDFLKTIDAIGIEDLFTDGNKKQPDDHSKPILGHLEKIKKAGKPVLLIEYGTTEKMKAISKQGAKDNNLILLQTDRNLKTLGTAGVK